MAVSLDANRLSKEFITKSEQAAENKLSLEFAKAPNKANKVVQALQSGHTMDQVRKALEKYLSLNRSVTNTPKLIDLFSELNSKGIAKLDGLFLGFLSDLTSSNRRLGIGRDKQDEKNIANQVMRGVLKKVPPENAKKLLGELQNKGIISAIKGIEIANELSQSKAVESARVSSSKQSALKLTKDKDQSVLVPPGFSISIAKEFEIKEAGSKENSNGVQADAESQFYIKVMETVENLIKESGKNKMEAKIGAKEVSLYANKLSNYFLKDSAA